MGESVGLYVRKSRIMREGKAATGLCRSPGAPGARRPLYARRSGRPAGDVAFGEYVGEACCFLSIIMYRVTVSGCSTLV